MASVDTAVPSSFRTPPRSQTRLPGTPLGGERDVRQRLHSPLHEMDGLDSASPPRPEVHTMATPSTPRDASASTITIEAITDAMESMLEKKFKERLDPMTKSVESITKRMDKVELNVKKNMDEMRQRMDTFERSGVPQDITENIQEIDTKIHSLSEAIDQMKMHFGETGTAPPSWNSTPRAAPADERKITAVANGFTDMEEEEAKEWIQNKLWDLWVPSPVDVYSKGEFTGILFLKFRTEDEKEQAIKAVKENLLKRGDKKINMFPDTPPGDRIPQSFLFALKRLLLSPDWNYDRKCVWVDIPSKTLYVGGERVISTGVEAWISSWILGRAGVISFVARSLRRW